jgi:hypothetical protein
MDKSQMVALLRKAEKTNADLDLTEHAVGFTPPGDDLPDGTMRTVITALHVALQLDDWNIVAEALAMVVNYEQSIRSAELDRAKFQPWLK